VRRDARFPQGPEPPEATAVRRRDPEEARFERRRASRSLWAACESLLGVPADARSLARALESLREAFECDGVALHAQSPTGGLEPWCARGAWQARAGDLRDCLSVPLFRGSERVGTLDLRARAGQRWRPEQLGLVKTASGVLGGALGARLELERLRNGPGRDPLTGLADGAAFRERLEQAAAHAQRHGVPMGLVMLDLDHFGALNRRYGRPAGDAVLREAALLLKLTLRESDILARPGGDAFAVILPEADIGPTQRCADRLRRAIEEHRFARAGHLSATAGVAASPRDGLDALELLDCADRALGVAKKSGRRRTARPEPNHVH
jgi:diguanylate cyclase (GGDEF)-like protein